MSGIFNGPELKERILELFNTKSAMSGSQLMRQFSSVDTEAFSQAIRSLESEDRLWVAGYPYGTDFLFCGIAMLPSQKIIYENEQRLKKIAKRLGL